MLLRWSVLGAGSILTLSGCPRADTATTTPVVITAESALERPEPDDRWITVETQPLPEHVPEPIRQALDDETCETLLLALPSTPTAWETVALARCYWRTDRVALARYFYDETRHLKPEPAVVREALRSELVAHFDHRMVLEATSADLDHLAGEGLQRDVETFLRIYFDRERCNTEISPIDVREPAVRAAIGTLFVECGDWAEGTDHSQAVALASTIWSDRTRIALLPDGHERLVLARASAQFATRKLRVHDGHKVDPAYGAEIRELARDTLQEVPRSSPLFPRALDLALSMYIASDGKAEALALLTEVGPSAAGDAMFWVTQIFSGPDAAKFADWRTALASSCERLDRLIALELPSEEAIPEALERCIGLADCDPDLEVALGDRAWWIGRLAPDYRLISDIHTTLDAIALAPPPAGSVGAEWVARLSRNGSLWRVNLALHERLIKRRRNLGLILYAITPESERPPTIEVEPLF